MGKEKLKRLAGICEKLGLTDLIAASADLLVYHKLSWWTDLLGIALGLCLLYFAVRVTPDDT